MDLQIRGSMNAEPESGFISQIQKEIYMGGFLMKNYRITVNGVAYEVSVEELDQTAAAQIPAAAPAAAPAPAKKAPVKAAGAEGSIKVNAPMPGKILEIKVKVGDSVRKGDSIVVLEAMKMENEIYAGEDGTVTSVNIAVGDMVEGGSVLVTMD